MRNKNTIGFPYFSLALNRALFYVNSLMRHGVRWIGMRFHYPIIWCQILFYRAPTKWEERDEITYCTWVDKSLGYYDPEEFRHLAFNWEDLHARIPEQE